MTSASLLPMWILTFFVILSNISTAQADAVLASDFDFKIGLKALEDLSHADFDILHQHTLDSRYGMYVAPNEMQPNLMLPLTQAASPGVLVSVGTQRCFMAVAKVAQISLAHCFDMDHGVVFFNLINIRLIELAKDRNDFQYLAIDAPIEEWLRRLSGTGMTKEMISDLFEFWNFHYRVNPMNKYFTRPPNNLTFAEMNYLYDDELFCRLKELVRRHAIRVDWMNIEKMNQVEALASDIKSEGQPLSILDLSNIGDWTGFKRLAPPILELSSVGTSSTRVLQTSTGDFLWIFGSFELTEQNKKHLREALPDKFGVAEGEPLNQIFSMKISRVDCSRLDCLKLKQDFEPLEKTWDEYLGPGSETKKDN